VPDTFEWSLLTQKAALTGTVYAKHRIKQLELSLDASVRIQNHTRRRNGSTDGAHQGCLLIFIPLGLDALEAACRHLKRPLQGIGWLRVHRMRRVIRVSTLAVTFKRAHIDALLLWPSG
jgi:hypothetical protein